MVTNFTVSLTKSQMTAISKKQARKATNPLLVVSIISLCLFALFLVVHFAMYECMGVVISFLVISVLGLTMVIITRLVAPKNAETVFKYYSADGVVTYGYELRETELVVTQPAIGNVTHYKYDMIQRVNEYADCVAVMLVTNQFLPILVNETTAPLISTLKSVAKIKK